VLGRPYTARATHARTTRAGTKTLNLHTAHARGAAARPRRTARRPLRRLLPLHAHLGAAVDLFGAARGGRVEVDVVVKDAAVDAAAAAAAAAVPSMMSPKSPA